MPAPVWGPTSRNAYLISQTARTRTVALLDPTLPAWFELRVDRRTSLPLQMHMTASAHFMTDRYSRYGTPREIRPPALGG
jgi:hypothetical protein